MPNRAAPLMQAEEDRLGRRAERLGLGQREHRLRRAAGFGDDHFAADHIGAGIRPCGERRDIVRLQASVSGAVERALRIAEAGLGAEIGAG